MQIILRVLVAIKSPLGSVLLIMSHEYSSSHLVYRLFWLLPAAALVEKIHIQAFFWLLWLYERNYVS